MSWESLTDEQIAAWLSMPKRVTNPKAREVTKFKHIERNYQVSGEQDTSFMLYVRQSTVLPHGFSCGLLIEMPGKERLTLCRYNGSDHLHGNPLEGTKADFVCHIHTATARYIAAGRKPETFAVPTSRYHTVEGALACLLEDCNIGGLSAHPDEPDLFQP